jgi:Tfp pilus assembly protein PilF
LSALRGELDRAETFLKKASEVNPDYPMPHYFLAGIYRSQNRVQESEQEWAEFLRLQGQPSKPPDAKQKREYF